MSFPTDPLDVVVEIAPGSEPSADPGTYDWVDISDRWRIDSPITIGRGKSSPLADTVPSSCSLTLDNSDGRFTPRNPVGPYYPDLQRNTPLRVRLRQFGDDFTRTIDAWGSPLNANPYFETDASGWSAIDGTIARSTAQSHEGSASLLITPSGTGPNPRAESTPVTVTPGASYQVSAWVRCAVSRLVDVNVTWFTSAGVFISNSGGAVSVAANTWTFGTSTVTAPPTAGRASVQVRMTGTPPSSNLLYTDEATLSPEAGGWDTATSGQPWTVDGAAAAQFFVAGTLGVHRVNALNTRFRSRTSGLALGNTNLHATVRLDLAPTGNYIRSELAARLDAVNDDFYALRVHVQTSGAVDLQLIRVVAGAETTLATAASGVTHTAGVALHLRFHAAGSELRGMVWRDDAAEPTTWQITATDATHTDGDVSVATLFPPGNTNTLPYNVIYDSIDVSSTRFTGYVDRWPPRWDPSGTLKWVPVQAFGTLKRLSSAGEATRSALYRYITENGFHLSAYWPLEDGSLATEGVSTVSAASPLTPSAPVRFGQASPAGGVGTMVDTSGAYLQSRIPVEYATDWRVECVVAQDAVPATTVRVLSWLCRGTIAAWNLYVTPTEFVVTGFTAVSGGTAVIGVGTGVVPQPGQLHHVRVDVTLSGSTNTLQVWVDGVSAGTATHSPSLTLQPNLMRVNPDASTADMPAVGHVAIWSATPLPATASAEVALGAPGELAHDRIEAVCVERGVPYAPHYSASTVTSEPMGPRPTGSVVAKLREPEATDGGILYELTSGHLSYRPRSTLYNQDVALALDYEARHIAPPFEPADDDAQLRNDVSARRPSGSEARYVDEAHVAAVGRYETSLAVNPDDDAQLEQTAAWAVHRGTVAEQRFDTIAIRMTAGEPVVSGWLGCDIGSRITVANVPTDLTPDDVDVILVGYAETIEFPRGWSVRTLCEPASSWTVGELDDLVLGRLDTAGSLVTAGDGSVPALTSSSADYVEISDADAVGFAVGQYVVLHDSAGRRKSPTAYEIVSTSSAFGFTRLYLLPPPEDPVSGSLSADGDRVLRVDSTTLTVVTTSGPVWTTDPAHMPLDINIAGERMTASGIAPLVDDPLDLTTSNGWGAGWTLVGTASDFSQSGGFGRHSLPANDTVRATLRGVSLSTFDVLTAARVTATPTGSELAAEVVGRWQDSNNHYRFELQLTTSGSVDIRIARIQTGARTVLADLDAASTFTAGTSVWVRAAGSGSSLLLKVWPQGAAEPAGWHLTATDTAFAAGDVGVLSLATGGNTNAKPVEVLYGSFTVTNPQTFTVVRSVNGVRKAAQIGDSVRLWQPLILGL